MRNVVWRFKRYLRGIIPDWLLDAYHFGTALLGAALCGFPSHHMLVLAVTGTKGKSSTTEMLNAIFEEAGHTTALINSIRFKIGTHSSPNELRMSMPGRIVNE